MLPGNLLEERQWERERIGSEGSATAITGSSLASALGSLCPSEESPEGGQLRVQIAQIVLAERKVVEKVLHAVAGLRAGLDDGRSKLLFHGEARLAKMAATGILWREQMSGLITDALSEGGRRFWGAEE